MSIFTLLSRVVRAIVTEKITSVVVAKAMPKEDTVTDLPWMAEGKRVLGLHETTNNSTLKKWLGSDGHALGDPSKLPWCGDFAETCIRLGLPKETLVANPYLAYNWLKFGKAVKPQYGAILVFHRGDAKSTRGHIGFYVGESATHYYVLGGNQGNMVSVSPMPKTKLRPSGARWPVTGPMQTDKTVDMSGGTVTSVT